MSGIVVGQCFDSLADFKTALRNWAINSSFTPAILDSDSRRVRAGCRTTQNCPFRIRCNFNNKTGIATVTTLENIHTCASNNGPGEPSIKRAETCKLKFLLEAVPQLLTVDRTTPTKAIIDAVKAKYGQEIAMRQAQKVKASLIPKTTDPCSLCGSLAHSQDSCPDAGRPGFSNPEDSMMDDVPEDIQVMDDVRAPTHIPQPQETPTRGRTPNGVYQHMPLSTQAPALERSRSAIDPELAGSRTTPYTIVHSPPPPQQHIIAPPQLEQRSMTNGPTQQQAFVASPNQHSHVPIDVRMEASRLMGRASQLMYEAARLNAEAARLMAASVTNP